MVKFTFLLELLIIFSFIKKTKLSKCLDKNNDADRLTLTICSNLQENPDTTKSYIDTTNIQNIIDSTNITNILESNSTIIETTQEMSQPETNTSKSVEKDVDCCLLTIRREEDKNIIRCIEIKKDEDEIENRIDAFHVMFKDASEISIECSNYKYINTYFFQIVLFFFIILVF